MKDHTKYRDLYLLSCLVVIALALRLYRITEQSIWHEEFVYVANIKICDLWTNVKLLFINVPEYGISPGGLVLYYFWIRLFPEPIWVWRLLPIFFGIFSIILLYYLGKWLRGWRVGFFAGFLMALSPFNIYIHQELKSYSFVLFLSLLSWFAFLNYIFDDKKKKWFWVGILSNLLLPWFHALYIIVPIIQFPLLLFIYEQNANKIRKIFQWLITNTIILSPFIVWIYWIDPPAYNLTLTLMEPLTPKFIITSLFGVDCVGISNELLPHWKTNTIDIVHSSLWKTLLNHWAVIDYGLLVLVILCITFFCLYTIKEIRITSIKDERVRKNFYLLYIFVFLPLPFLCMRFITGEPLFLPLYFYHFYVFIYLLIANVIFIFNKHIFRFSLLFIFIFLYFAQCLSLLNFVSRPDYRSAMAYLEKSVKKGDTVLDLQIGANVFEPWKIYKSRNDYELVPVFSLQAVAEETVKKLSMEGENKKNDCLWVLMETTFISWIYNVDPTYLLVKHLSPLGIKVSIKHFPGKFNLYVLKINLDEHKEIKDQQIVIPPLGKINFEEIKEEFQLNDNENKDDKNQEKIFLRYFSIYPPLYSYNYILVLNSMIRDGELYMGEKICNYLIKKSPKFYHVMYLNSLISLSKGQKENAKEEMSKIFVQSYFFKSMYENLFRTESDFREGKDILLLEKLEGKGYHILNKAVLSIISKKR